MPRGSRSPFAPNVLPFLPAVAGLAISAWRFRMGDSVAGLLAGLGGFALMVVVATRLPDVGPDT
jgi:hypothetical protein